MSQIGICMLKNQELLESKYYMIQPFMILEELNETNSRNDKLAILEKYKDHDLFKKICHATYDGFTSYYIKKIPERDCPATGSYQDPWSVVFDSLNKLSSREITGYAARDHVQFMLNHLTEEDAFVFTKILERDLGVNATGSSMNLLPTLR